MLATDFLSNKGSGLLDQSEWERFVKGIENLKILNYKWVTIERGYAPIEKSAIHYETFAPNRTATYDDLARELTLVSIAASTYIKSGIRFPSRIKRQQEEFDSYSIPESARPELISYLENRRLVLEENLAQFGKAEVIAFALRDRALELRESISQSDMNRPIIDEDWEVFQRKFTGLLTITEQTTEGADAKPSLEELCFDETSPLSLRRNFNRSYEEKRQFQIQTEFLSNPDLLPEKISIDFEESWSLETEGRYDLMGGLPIWDHVNPSLFSELLFRRDQDETVLRDIPFMIAEPPFDQDNALLLQLFSRDLPGWMWGDVSHLAFVIPRAQLAQNNFSQVVAIISG